MFRATVFSRTASSSFWRCCCFLGQREIQLDPRWLFTKTLIRASWAGIPNEYMLLNSHSRQNSSITVWSVIALSVIVYSRFLFSSVISTPANSSVNSNTKPELHCLVQHCNLSSGKRDLNHRTAAIVIRRNKTTPLVYVCLSIALAPTFFRNERL